MTDRFEIQSTSLSSAVGSPIVLRETEQVRLVFLPLLINNANNPEASVKGSFVYQRKRRDDEWEDIRGVSLAGLRSGEGYQLTLSSAELLEFMSGVRQYYAVHEKLGIPMGKHTFDVRPAQVSPLVDAILANQDVADALLKERGPELVRLLVDWSGDHDVATIARAIAGSDPSAVAHLEAAARLADLRAVLHVWQEHAEDSDEDFWQTKFAERPWLLTHLFGGQPFVLVRGKMYVGGKTIFDQGGALADFVVRNRLTNAMSLIEIKTPVAPLLGASPYRDGVFPPSRDLGGAVTQVLCQRDVLQKQFLHVAAGTDLAAFDPQCVVVIGQLNEMGSDRLRCFELYRRQLSDVLVVTFDEVFERAAMLIEVFEASDSRPSAVGPRLTPTDATGHDDSSNGSTDPLPQ